MTRVREELEALARRPVVEISAGAGRGGRRCRRIRRRPPRCSSAPRRCCTGWTSADVVAFLDFDQELLAPRYRAAEEALALLVLAGRLLGGRRGSGRLLVQTRLPHHEVVQAALLGDPARVADGRAGPPPAAALPAVGRAGHGVGGRRRRVHGAAGLARRGSRCSGRATASGWCEPTSTPRCSTRWPPRPARPAASASPSTPSAPDRAGCLSAVGARLRAAGATGVVAGRSGVRRSRRGGGARRWRWRRPRPR